MIKSLPLLLIMAACAPCSARPERSGSSKGETRDIRSPAAPKGGLEERDAGVPRPRADHAALLQAVLDDANLDRYFHINARPERSPLSILQNEVVADSPPLVKFGVPVKYVANISAEKDSALVFAGVRVQGDTAEVHLRYPPEGIIGKVTLTRQSDRWTSRGLKIVER